MLIRRIELQTAADLRIRLLKVLEKSGPLDRTHHSPAHLTVVVLGGLDESLHPYRLVELQVEFVFQFLVLPLNGFYILVVLLDLRFLPPQLLTQVSLFITEFLNLTLLFIYFPLSFLHYA